MSRDFFFLIYKEFSFSKNLPKKKKKIYFGWTLKNCFQTILNTAMDLFEGEIVRFPPAPHS